MRISGGRARGITLVVPKGDAVRPATDGMRQSVFSSLGARVSDVRFVDLFAGSGAYGLEALSRGAAGGVFVEKNAKAVACLKQNLTAVCKSLQRDAANTKVLQMDAVDALSTLTESPDMVFIDPPYELIPRISEMLFHGLGLMLKGSVDPVVIFEMPGEIELSPAGWICIKRLGKGARQPTVAFFKRE